MVSFSKILPVSRPISLDPRYNDLANERTAPAFKTICSRGLLQSSNPLEGHVSEQPVKTTALYENIVRSERGSHLIFGTLCVQELVPRQDVALLQENDFQRHRTLLCRLPGLQAIGQYSGHVFVPPCV